MRCAAKGIRALGLKFDLVLTSPLTRARQTAEIVAAAFDPAPAVRIHKPLGSGGTTQEIVGALAGKGQSTALLVGHEPDLSHLASALLLKSRAALNIAFKKGGLCRIDFDGEPRAGNGTLIFHLTPKALRVLGE